MGTAFEGAALCAISAEAVVGRGSSEPSAESAPVSPGICIDMMGEMPVICAFWPISRNHVSHAFQIGTRNAEFGKLVERQILQALGVSGASSVDKCGSSLSKCMPGERAPSISHAMPHAPQRRRWPNRLANALACFLISRKEQMHRACGRPPAAAWARSR